MKRKKILIATITLILLVVLGSIGFCSLELSNYSGPINYQSIHRAKVKRPSFKELPKVSIPKPPVFY